MRIEIILGRVVERNSVAEVQGQYKISHGPWSARFCPGYGQAPDRFARLRPSYAGLSS